MKVLIISKASTNAEYRKKYEELGKLVDLTVVIPDKFMGYKFENAQAKNYKIIKKPLAFKNSHHLFYFRNIEEVIKNVKPDIVHIDEEPFNLITYLTLRAIKKANRNIKTLFFTWQNIPKKYIFPFSYFENYAFKNVNCAIAGGKEARNLLVDKGFKKDISIIPQFGVDEKFYKKLNVKKNKNFAIGYAGRLVEEKGIYTLLKAVNNLECELLIIGEGPYKKEIMRIIGSCGFNAKVNLINSVPSREIPKLFNGLDVLVLPSKTTKHWKEQFGRVLIEAMACEVPVIGSSSGEIQNVLEDAGLIFKEGNAEDLRKKISMLRSNAKLRNKLAKKGRKRMLKNFTQKIIAGKTFEVYKKLI